MRGKQKTPQCQQSHTSMKGSIPDKTANLTEIRSFISDSKNSARESDTTASKDFKLYLTEVTVSYLVSSDNCDGKFHKRSEATFQIINRSRSNYSTHIHKLKKTLKTPGHSTEISFTAVL